LTLVETLIDEGFSASSGAYITKGKFGQFLKDADSGKYQSFVLVAEELDRISRLGIAETSALIQRILKAGVEVRLAQTGRVISPKEDLSTAVLNVVESFAAAEYSRKLRERISNSMKAKRVAMIETGPCSQRICPLG
jgi:DNA invertase Pin-like site-specific DNA recombinase